MVDRKQITGTGIITQGGDQLIKRQKQKNTCHPWWKILDYLSVLSMGTSISCRESINQPPHCTFTTNDLQQPVILHDILNCTVLHCE